MGDEDRLTSSQKGIDRSKKEGVTMRFIWTEDDIQFLPADPNAMAKLIIQQSQKK